MEQLTKANFDEKINNKEKIVAVEFYTDWCGDCKMIMPILEDIEAERDDVVFYKVNADEEAELKAKYNVKNVPTIISMKAGTEYKRVVEPGDMDLVLDILG